MKRSRVFKLFLSKKAVASGLSRVQGLRMKLLRFKGFFKAASPGLRVSEFKNCRYCYGGDFPRS